MLPQSLIGEQIIDCCSGFSLGRPGCRRNRTRRKLDSVVPVPSIVSVMCLNIVAYNRGRLSRCRFYQFDFRIRLVYVVFLQWFSAPLWRLFRWWGPMNPDHPIESCSDDILGRKPIARRIARQLLSAPRDHSIVFGLYGPWGSGKTSLLNMIAEEMETAENPPVVVRFNPWNYPSSDNLITPFLALISETLQRSPRSCLATKTMRSLTKTLKRYSDVLASTADAFKWVPGLNILAVVFRALGKMDNMTASPDRLKSRLSKLLIDSNTRVLVIIDDLDRLSSSAVRSVFQLVAAEADFPGVNYILMYDLNNVIKALKEVQGCDGEQYLEIIVQVPIELYGPSGGLLTEIFAQELNEFFAIHELDDEEMNDIERCLMVVARGFKNVRDLRRLMNVYEVDFAEANNKVAPADLLAMSALRLLVPRIVPWVNARRSVLAGGVRGGYEYTEAEKTRITFMTEIREMLNGDDRGAKYVFELLCEMFPRFANSCGIRVVGISEALLKINRRIACPEILDRYLSGALESYTFPREDAMRLVRTGFADELEAFFSQAEAGVASTVLSAAVEISADLDSCQVENITRALLRSSIGAESDSTFHGLLSIFKTSLERLLYVLGKEAASRVVSEETANMSFKRCAALAVFINGQELAYARLAGKNEIPDDQLISLDCLLDIEDAIKDSLSKRKPAPYDLSYTGAQTLLYLWNCFDNESYERLVTNGVLKEPLGYVIYATFSLGRHINKEERGWTFPIDVSSDIDFQKIYSCIDEAIRSEDYWKLPVGSQRLIAALRICAEKIMSGANHLNATASMTEVDKLLRSWEVRYAPRSAVRS